VFWAGYPGQFMPGKIFPFGFFGEFFLGNTGKNRIPEKKFCGERVFKGSFKRTGL